jgi:hypothetical protein
MEKEQIIGFAGKGINADNNVLNLE